MTSNPARSDGLPGPRSRLTHLFKRTPVSPPHNGLGSEGPPEISTRSYISVKPDFVLRLPFTFRKPWRRRPVTSETNAIHALVRNSSNVGGMSFPIEGLPGMHEGLVPNRPVPTAPNISVGPIQSPTPLRFPSTNSHVSVGNLSNVDDVGPNTDGIPPLTTDMAHQEPTHSEADLSTRNPDGASQRTYPSGLCNGYLNQPSMHSNFSDVVSVTSDSKEAVMSRTLDPAKQAWFDSSLSGICRRACARNTRRRILDSLHKWANDPTSPKIYWLSGMAGTGKTTIAYSFCSELERDHRLGASFFCCRTVPECRDVARIVPTIAYQLARSSSSFQSALCEVLVGSYPDVDPRSISLQFERLICDPLTEVEDTLTQVLVVVIDGLDECAGHGGAQPLLDVLIHHAGGLPVKFFITGRPEPSVHHKLGLQGLRTRSVLCLHDINESPVQTDIETYLIEELKDAPGSLERDKILTSRAKNLFIHAATAVRYIKLDGLDANSYARLNAILEVHSDPSIRRPGEIDGTYTAILTGALDNPKLEIAGAKTIQALLNTIVCAMEPMNTQTLAGLLGLLGGKQEVELLLEPLRSVLHVPGTTDPVLTLHISFHEYLLDHERSGEFYCDKAIHCKLMVRRCFETMTELLRFNICDLESHLFNEDVPFLQERIDRAISPQLFYACRYWGDHLKLVLASDEILQLLSDFLSKQILFWVEVLNLKGCAGACGEILLQAHMWLESSQATSEIRDLVLDARKFVVAFSASPVSRSTLHIYISMLPLWSRTDPMWEAYGQRMKGLIEPQGAVMNRGNRSNVAWTLTSKVMSIAVSSDGSHVVSGSEDSLLRIWDLRSGKPVLGPLEGHTASVVSVAFSPDNARIASGSNDHTIRIWDTRTGCTLVEPLKCGLSCVTSVAFSPRGDFVVSGSLDNTICVWDARTGGLAAGPFKTHTDLVKSVAFSPKGFFVASGSDDHTVRVCDFRSGNLVAGPFRSHSKPVNSVAFSPDGAVVASGSEDCSIHIWNFHHNDAVPIMTFQGHTDSITSVTFSPDGAYVASGSYDRTIRVWSLDTQDIAFGPFTWHTDAVGSLMFTPDGTCIVSGAHDKTIRIWDLKTNFTTAVLLEGHTDHVCSVAFSPDGQHIISSSRDSTIRMWNAQSGSAVPRPFRQVDNTMASSVAFSPRGYRIALGLTDGSARIWDQQNGRDVVEPFRMHGGWVTSVAFSPNGRHIASSSATGEVFVWSARNGRVLLGPLRHSSSSSIRSVSFSPDGKRLVSSADNGTICVWNTREGTRAVQMTHEHDKPVRSAAFSPDSRSIVSGSDDHTVRIWDAKTGRTDVGPLEGHAGLISSVSYSFNGALVASGSHDRTICVWDAKNGTLVAELKGHMDRIESVAFSPNDMRIVSGSFDQVIRVWDTTNVPVITGDCNVNDDGWMIGRDGRILLWVPNNLRTGLMRPQDPVVVHRRDS